MGDKCTRVRSIRPKLAGRGPQLKKTLGKRKLSESEWEIMKVFWDKGSLALRDVVHALEGHDGLAYDTVKTLMRRMVDKEWLNTTRVGSCYLYSPAVERSKAVRQALREFSSRVLDGMLSPVVSYLSEQERLTDDDLKELKLLLEQHESKRRKE